MHTSTYCQLWHLRNVLVELLTRHPLCATFCGFGNPQADELQIGEVEVTGEDDLRGFVFSAQKFFIEARDRGLDLREHFGAAREMGCSKAETFAFRIGDHAIAGRFGIST